MTNKQKLKGEELRGLIDRLSDRTGKRYPDSDVMISGTRDEDALCAAELLQAAVKTNADKDCEGFFCNACDGTGADEYNNACSVCNDVEPPMTNTPTLLPCPFCHGDKLRVVADHSYYGVCYGCGAEGPHQPDESAAIAAWNRRPSIRPDGEMVERACKIVHEGVWKHMGSEQRGQLRNRMRAALTAALQVQAQGGWRPIESAPKDGTRFAFTNGEYVGVGRYINGHAFAADSWGAVERTIATHWQPLPAPPESQHNTGER
jgi:Lar family restriction alleviation protein